MISTQLEQRFGGYCASCISTLLVTCQYTKNIFDYTGSSPSSTAYSPTTLWDYSNPTDVHDYSPTLYLTNTEETLKALIFGLHVMYGKINIYKNAFL